MDNTVLKSKTFIFLVNFYYAKFLNGLSITEITGVLSTEECIYLYNKEIEAEDLKAQTGFIEKDEDILENWKALSYAAYKFLNTKKTGHKVVDNYILEFSSKSDEEILGITTQGLILKMTNN